MDTGHFLARHQEFSFDAEAYLQAHAIREAIDDRRSEFESWLASPHRFLCPRRLIDAWLQTEAEAVPAYAAFHGARFDDLPLIDKRRLRAAADLEFVSRRFNSCRLWHHSTSGTSGRPVRFFFDTRFYFEQLLVAVARVCQRSGAKAAFERQVFCLHLTDTQGGGRNEVFVDPTGATGYLLRVAIDQSAPGALAGVAQQLTELRPAVITARPEILAVLASREDIRSALHDAKPELVIASGSQLPRQLEDRLRDELQLTISVAYGLTEFGLIASRCPRCRSLHLDDPRVELEIRGEGKKTCLEGELVLSSLSNEAMPLLRYQTGDRASLRRTKCPRAARGIAIENIAGRLVPLFRFPNGSVFSPTHFTNLFALFPLREYQLTQTEPEVVEFLYEPAEATDADRLRRQLEHYLSDAIPYRVKVTAHQHHFGTSKVARFRSLL